MRKIKFADIIYRLSTLVMVKSKKFFQALFEAKIG